MYKVGDRVRVRKDLKDGALYGAQSYFDIDMKCMLGKTVTIASASQKGYTIKEFGWMWTDEMFEPTPFYASRLMELARENPAEYEGKRYKVVDGTLINRDGNKYKEAMIERGDLMTIRGNDCIYLAHINSHTTVEPITDLPKPVLFMEAVNSGKLIKPNVNDNLEYKLVSFWLNYLAENTYGDRSKLINGTWYIE